MTDQSQRAARLRALHVKGDPLVLYNVWDAGGAKALAEVGAMAIATGSWAMAAAQGYEDGEAIPLDFVLRIVERIAMAVDLPVTVDFEGGYAAQPEQVAKNVSCVIQAGAVGVNFEDRILRGEGLYSIQAQAERIGAIRQAAQQESVDLFINARTDLFLGTDPETHRGLIGEAIARDEAYREAGADGLFIPGLTDPSLIAKIVDAASLPVNVMILGDLVSIESVAGLGVARVSYGPGPFFTAVADFKDRFATLR